MKTLRQILTIAIVMLIGSTAIAQDRELTDEQKAQIEEKLSEYFEKLDLSEEQKPKFEEITSRYADKMKALKGSSKSRFGKYKEFKSIRKEKNKEMKALLNKDQYEIYKEMQKERQENMKEKRQNKN